MSISNLDFKINSHGDVLGVIFNNPSLETLDAEVVAGLIATYGLVIFKRTTFSINDCAKFQMKMGYHQFPEVWCRHSDEPIFWRVSNKDLGEGLKGLFEDSDLDWHSNIIFSPDSHEVVGIYAPDYSGDVCTYFVNSIPLWKNLSESEKKLYKDIKLHITEKTEDTYLKKQSYDLENKIMRKQMFENLKKQDIRSSVNITDEERNHFLEPRFFLEGELKLVPDHPLGSEGLYFPFLNVSSLKNRTNDYIANGEEIFHNIVEKYISERYVYKHKWEKGDLVFSDQLLTLHRRDKQNTEKRELLRTAFWYKDKNRKHHGRSI